MPASVRRVYLILDKEGCPVGMPYLHEHQALRDMQSPAEDFPERGPYTVATFRREELTK